MTVIEPLGYEVDFTVEEFDIIIKCKKVLQDIVETLEEKKCNTLEAEYNEYTETISLETLASIVMNLDTLRDVNRIY